MIQFISHTQYTVHGCQPQIVPISLSHSFQMEKTQATIDTVNLRVNEMIKTKWTENRLHNPLIIFLAFPMQNPINLLPLNFLYPFLYSTEAGCWKLHIFSYPGWAKYNCMNQAHQTGWWIQVAQMFRDLHICAFCYSRSHSSNWNRIDSVNGMLCLQMEEDGRICPESTQSALLYCLLLPYIIHIIMNCFVRFVPESHLDFRRFTLWFFNGLVIRASY